jgi:hypothetical protein
MRRRGSITSGHGTTRERRVGGRRQIGQQHLYLYHMLIKLILPILTAHNAATAVQGQAGEGTYAAERRIGYKALRKAGLTKQQARRQIQRADENFKTLDVTGDTTTRIPGNRQ